MYTFFAPLIMNTNELILQASKATAILQALTDEAIGTVLCETAEALRKATDLILAANRRDLERMEPTNPKYDRLQLTAQRIESIAADMQHVATLPTPLGQTLSLSSRPNGMTIRKVSVPFGVIGIIYEARPNVTADVFSLCMKSGNVCLLKGGSDAEHTNRQIVEVIHAVLRSHHIDTAVCTLLPADREATACLLEAVGKVDLIIPRGSSALINYVRSNAKVPVIETGAGICHAYFDESADLAKGMVIVENAKTRRVSVCNALDCLLIHRNRLSDLAELCASLADKNVIIYADPDSFCALQGYYPSALLHQATEEHFGTEFLDYKMSIRTVINIDGALSHIARYSSRHSECIISEDMSAIRRFQQAVDAACVYANVSTAFTDGAQFGFGAEIGISTQKLHARGPMALNELTTYKYLIEGSGQVRWP